MLTGIAEYCATLNVPGLRRIEYAPIAWVDAASYTKVISSAHNWQYAVPFSMGDWLRAYVLPVGRLWQEREQRSPQGAFWQVEAGGNTPRLRPQVHGELQEMSQHRFLLRLTDRNGIPWILGTLESPFGFQASANSNPTSNEYNLRWVSEMPHRAYGYQPIL